MSIIYDDQKLIDQLVKHAEDFENKFSKKGQAAPDNQSLVTLRSLLDSLADQIPGTKDPNAPAEISHEKGFNEGDPQLTVVNLEGLGALTDFLMQNKITVDGQRVAYDLAEDPNSEDYQLYQLEPNAGLLEVEDRSRVTRGFYVNKDLLNKYIQSLQAQLAARPNPVMDVQLRKIIQQANTQLESGLSEKYTPPEKTLPANEVLTNFPQVLDYKYYNKDGDKVLTFGDVSTAAGIKAWVNNNGISVEIPGREGGPLGINHPQFDFCVVARTLYAKAQWLLRTKATTPELEKKYTAFVKKITEVAPTLQGPDGKACSLAAGTTTTAPAGKDKQTQQAGAGAQKVSPQILNNIISTLPFSIRDINFDRIDSFFGLVQQIMSNNGTAMQQIGSTDGSMRRFSSTYMRQGEKIIPLGMYPRQFFSMLKDPGKQFMPALDELNDILDTTRSVVEAFYATYVGQLDDNQKAYVLGQIGRTPNDRSIYTRNSGDLQNLRQAVNVK
jgi:hypothetical protein